VSAQWIPYAVHDLARRFARRGKPFPKNVLKENRIYVTCQTDDDLDHVLGYAGEDNLVIGTDYGHADNAAEIEALRVRLFGPCGPDVELLISIAIVGETQAEAARRLGAHKATTYFRYRRALAAARKYFLKYS